MGCDIHSYVEVRRDDRWYEVTDARFADGGSEPFGWGDYDMFGFLADVRNYAHSPVIAAPRGVPDDASPEVRDDHAAWGYDAHSASWLTVAELLAYDYDQTFWNRRITRRMPSGSLNGAALAEEGEGTHPTLREFLGDAFFQDLETLHGLGDPTDVRVVLWFDN